MGLDERRAGGIVDQEGAHVVGDVVSELVIGPGVEDGGVVGGDGDASGAFGEEGAEGRRLETCDDDVGRRTGLDEDAGAVDLVEDEGTESLEALAIGVIDGDLGSEVRRGLLELVEVQAGDRCRGRDGSLEEVTQGRRFGGDGEGASRRKEEVTGARDRVWIAWGDALLPGFIEEVDAEWLCQSILV